MNHLFVGAGNSLQEVRAVELDEESLRDIATRVKMQPHFLGEPLVVIAEAVEFPNLRGPEDGYVLVALDRNGQVVVIELMQGLAPSDRPIRSLRFAAAIARLGVEELGKIARAFISRPENLAIARLWNEANVEMNEESVELSSLLATVFVRDADDYSEAINRMQRIIIAAESFDSRMVGVVEWLFRNGADVRGLQYKKFMIGGQEIFHAQQVVPEIDPAVDAASRQGHAPEVEEPWRVKGLTYYLDRLTPAMGNKLQELLQFLQPYVFATDWAQKYYFLVRGARQNLRVRIYQRNRLDIGFVNASLEAVGEMLGTYRLDAFDANMIGGYDKSPFVSVTSDTEFDARWTCLLGDWLNGADPGTSSPSTGNPAPLRQ